MSNVNIFWFRRDLRLHDNAGLYQALTSQHPVIPLFIFDRHTLDHLKEPEDVRVHFIHDEIQHLRSQLQELGSDMLVKYGTPEKIFDQLTGEYRVQTVFTNRDYEPYAIERDQKIQKLLKDKGIQFKTFKDHAILEQNELVKQDGNPYVVFTPYKNQWHKALKKVHLARQPSENALKDGLAELQADKMLTLKEMGFEASSIPIPSRNIDEALIEQYDQIRNYPAQNGTSRLGVHLRFGTISIRELAVKAQHLNSTFLNELVWRDFYQMILWFFPEVVQKAFKPAYDLIEWRNDEAGFEQWCKGETGFPMVDAGMRQLNAIGYMHNRLRMVTASFLTKHLLIDWRWGEAYFAQKLLDYELASNNGGWQWAAGTGVDAAPYFRVFNPNRQMERFDPEGQFIRYWIPEYGTPAYPKPMVDHKFARERALSVYKKALDAYQ